MAIQDALACASHHILVGHEVLQTPLMCHDLDFCISVQYCVKIVEIIIMAAYSPIVIKLSNITITFLLDACLFFCALEKGTLKPERAYV